MAESTEVLGRLQNAFDGLAPRERRMIALLTALLAIVACGGMYFVLSGALEDVASRVKQQKDSLEVLQVAAAQYDEAVQRIDAAEERLAEYKDQRFKPFVEQEASKLGVELGPITDQGDEAVGTVKQTTFKVELKRLQLETALDFLYALETSGYPLSVQNARFKRLKRGEDILITLTLEVVAYSLVEGASP